ncbi:Glutathione import ATP-binding protein GsiA [bacterium HR40]|nr:Glutathione import ATP-binding protein GsiA [bacterium HR40]
MTLPLLAVRDLAVTFGDGNLRLAAVDGISFDIPPRRTLALVGESGSGKTVTGHALLGILPPTARIESGRALFADPAAAAPVDLLSLDPDSEALRQLRGNRMAIVFQEPGSALSPLHTIGDQVSEALLVHSRVGRAEARERTLAMLARVGFPDPGRAFRSYPFELSGGLRQRAVIAMALVCGPVLLVADEPTTALDVTVQAQILGLLQELREELGMAMLLITHDLGIVAALADELVVLRRGRVMEAGAAAEVLREPRHPYTRALLEAVPRLHRQPASRLRRVGDIPERIRIAQLWPQWRGRPRASGTILEVRDLTKRFVSRRGSPWSAARRTVEAVVGVSFAIEAGECFALVGESGSGKTTVCKLIVRALEADSGEILFTSGSEVLDIRSLAERQLVALRRHIQYVFQDPFTSLNPRMTAFEIIAEPLVVHRIGNRAERRERVRLLLEAVGLEARHMTRYPHSFSGGERQRIGIARALALGPELLICDEPVSALDVSVQAQVLELLRDLQRELGLTYMFVSHDLAVVRHIAHRVGVMCRGRLVELAPTDALFADPRHPYTRALLEAVPDPDRPRDFRTTAFERVADPTSWPEPFALAGGPGWMRQVAAGHWVRVSGGGEMHA